MKYTKPFFIDTTPVSKLVDSQEDMDLVVSELNEAHGDCLIFHHCWREDPRPVGKDVPRFSSYSGYNEGRQTLAEFLGIAEDSDECA